MSITDPIADMLTRIRNAARVRDELVDIPSSRLKEEIAKKLHEEGFITRFEVLVKGSKKILRITLKYDKTKKSVISNLKRISTPGRRVYIPAAKVTRVLRGFGMAILSTNKGILTDREAKKIKVGGEVLCHVW